MLIWLTQMAKAYLLIIIVRNHCCFLGHVQPHIIIAKLSLGVVAC